MAYRLISKESGTICTFNTLEEAYAELPTNLNELQDSEDYWTVEDAEGPVAYFNYETAIESAVKEEFYVGYQGHVIFDIYGLEIVCLKVTSRSFQFQGKKLSKAKLIEAVANHLKALYLENPDNLVY